MRISYPDHPEVRSSGPRQCRHRGERSVCSDRTVVAEEDAQRFHAPSLARGIGGRKVHSALRPEAVRLSGARCRLCKVTP